jgi:hypothetical protein
MTALFATDGALSWRYPGRTKPSPYFLGVLRRRRATVLISALKRQWAFLTVRNFP